MLLTGINLVLLVIIHRIRTRIRAADTTSR